VKRNDGQRAEPHEATIEGEKRQVKFGADNSVLVDGSRYEFIPVKKSAFKFSTRTLVSVSRLLWENDGWVVDGNPLQDCISAEMQKDETERNQKYTALDKFLNDEFPPGNPWLQGLSAVLEASEHLPETTPVSAFDPHACDWQDPQKNPYLAGLNLHGNQESNQTNRQDVRAVAWFEDDANPVLLRRFDLPEPVEHAHAVAEVLAPKFKELAAKVETVDGKADKLLADTQTLKDMGAEESASRDKWRENPLCCRDAMADYLLTMDGRKINHNVAVALLGIAYGDTRAQAATKASVSEATIKRALKTARTTDYAKLFARTRAQKLQAKQSMKKPDEAWSLIRKLAEEDPEKLRSQIEQVIQRVQDGVESETAWDATTQNLN